MCALSQSVYISPPSLPLCALFSAYPFSIFTGSLRLCVETYFTISPDGFSPAELSSMEGSIVFGVPVCVHVDYVAQKQVCVCLCVRLFHSFFFELLSSLYSPYLLFVFSLLHYSDIPFQDDTWPRSRARASSERVACARQGLPSLPLLYPQCRGRVGAQGKDHKSTFCHQCMKENEVEGDAHLNEFAHTHTYTSPLLTCATIQSIPAFNKGELRCQPAAECLVCPHKQNPRVFATSSPPLSPLFYPPSMGLCHRISRY